MTLKGLAVVVTGGASGIGRAFGRHLGGLGSRVWVLDRDERALAEIKSDWEGAGGVRCLQCDVGDDQQVTTAIGRVHEESGGIDVVVNCAAVLKDQALVSRVGGRMRTHSTADWEETLKSNLTGTFLVSREVAAAMIRARRGGLIVNVSSISRAGNAGQTAYAATKAAIDALTVTWSQELAVYGIRVAALAPGMVETGMTERIPAVFMEQIRDRTPSRRYGRLDELGHAIQFVIENDYFNGKVLELDGGLRF